MPVNDKVKESIRKLSAAKVVNTYTLLCDLRSKGVLSECLSRGIVSIQYMEYLQAYEKYKGYRNKGLKKMVSYQHTAEDLKCSTSKIRLVVAAMER